MQVVKSGQKPIDLTVCDYFHNPVGYSIDHLSMSWKLPAVRNGIRQTAYQIVAAHNKDSLDTNPIWDSGKVISDMSINVPYGGKPLLSRERVYWKVRYWDEHGKISGWSDINFFEAGLLSNSDWHGKWILSSDPRIKQINRNTERTKTSKRSADYVPPAYFRKEVKVENSVVSARLYVACRGVFQFYINGEKVGKDFWGTGWTDYNKRIQTNTYDITTLVSSGENTFAAVIGDGWYSGNFGWKPGSRGLYGDRPELLAQIEIVFKDGTRKTISTDDTWKYSYGPIIYSDIYDGEKYDARREMPNWNKNGFDDSKWKNPKSKNVEAIPLLEPRRNQPIVVKDVLLPISVRKISDGTYIFDLGQNMTGRPRIKIPSDEGRKITVRYGEMLNKDGTLYTENYRSAECIDTYVSAGKFGFDEWEPMFTFRGFRYVELSGLQRNSKPTSEWVRGVVLYNDIPLTGSFVCSNPKVNILQNNIQWTQRSNFFSVPMDCPQRDERLGWAADAQIYCSTATFNMNVKAFFAKWLIDLSDTINSEGAVGHMAPIIDNNYGSAGWSDAMVVATWDIYMAYGDKNILSQNYNAMKSWVDYIEKESKDLIRPDTGFGDWLQPNSRQTNGNKYSPMSDAPNSLIGTAYFVRCADLLSKSAEILGYVGDAKKYAGLADDVRKAFRAKFISSDGVVVGDCQTSYLLPLAFDIVPKAQRVKIFDNLIKAINRDGGMLNTGIIGTQFLNPILTEFGRPDLAYKILLNEVQPSWLHAVNMGATTLWERWDGFNPKEGFGTTAMNSFNHPVYGSIGKWLYKYVAGIWYDESVAGYKNIMFAPTIGGGLTFAASNYETPYGTATSSWKMHEGIVEWKVIIPPNATGTLKFPTKNRKSICINGNLVDDSKLLLDNDIFVMRNVESGTYEIQVKSFGFSQE